MENNKELKKLPLRLFGEMKNIALKVKNTTVDFADLKTTLEKCKEVLAAYLFGSAASGEVVVNDLDILVLLHPNMDKNKAYINITYHLSESLKITEAYLDLLFFDPEEAGLTVLTRAINKGILLKNDNPEYLSDTVDKFSRFLLENDAMIVRGKRLRQERLEIVSAT